MGLAFQSVEIPHLTNVMQASGSSLTFLMDDLQARRRECLNGGKSGADLEEWVNALQRQEHPLVASTKGRANLEAWLNLTEG